MPGGSRSKGARESGADHRGFIRSRDTAVSFRAAVKFVPWMLGHLCFCTGECAFLISSHLLLLCPRHTACCVQFPLSGRTLVPKNGFWGSVGEVCHGGNLNLVAVHITHTSCHWLHGKLLLGWNVQCSSSHVCFDQAAFHGKIKGKPGSLGLPYKMGPNVKIMVLTYSFRISVHIHSDMGKVMTDQNPPARFQSILGSSWGNWEKPDLNVLILTLSVCYRSPNHCSHFARAVVAEGCIDIF